jgi:hypothetical protein
MGGMRWIDGRASLCSWQNGLTRLFMATQHFVYDSELGSHGKDGYLSHLLEPKQRLHPRYSESLSFQHCH